MTIATNNFNRFAVESQLSDFSLPFFYCSDIKKLRGAAKSTLSAWNYFLFFHRCVIVSSSSASFARTQFLCFACFLPQTLEFLDG